MDPRGARHLLARIKAGVRVGSRIELVSDAVGDTGLCAGDRGVVNEIEASGHLLVEWDRGFSAEIDPENTPFRPLAA